jgi:hypothetical protein
LNKKKLNNKIFLTVIIDDKIIVNLFLNGNIECMATMLNTTKEPYSIVAKFLFRERISGIN